MFYIFLINCCWQYFLIKCLIKIKTIKYSLFQARSLFVLMTVMSKVSKVSIQNKIKRRKSLMCALDGFNSYSYV